MAVERLAVSFDPDLAQEVREAASEAADGNVSAWLTDAARQKLRQRNLQQAIQRFESEHGEISDDELADLDAEWPG
jgi:metal-responsive CopG/Arc/MetJ family transcriptional regulator